MKNTTLRSSAAPNLTGTNPIAELCLTQPTGSVTSTEGRVGKHHEHAQQDRAQHKLFINGVFIKFLTSPPQIHVCHSEKEARNSRDVHD